MYNLKHALRNLRRNGVYSVVNIAGLSVSLAVAILMLLWVNDELNYDKAFTKVDRIYQTLVSFQLGGKDMAWKVASYPLGEHAVNEIPEIESQCRITPGSAVFKYEDKESAQVERHFVDTSYFTIFGFELAAGDPRRPFVDRNSIILSRKLAENLFGSCEDALGKAVREDVLVYNVSAVMENIAENISIK